MVHGRLEGAGLGLDMWQNPHFVISSENMADTTCTKKELFISYGREPETVNFVRLLKRDLEKNG